MAKGKQMCTKKLATPHGWASVSTPEGYLIAFNDLGDEDGYEWAVYVDGKDVSSLLEACGFAETLPRPLDILVRAEIKRRRDEAGDEADIDISFDPSTIAFDGAISFGGAL